MIDTHGRLALNHLQVSQRNHPKRWSGHTLLAGIRSLVRTKSLSQHPRAARHVEANRSESNEK